MLRNDNLDPGLYARGFNVWQPSWTGQEAYGNAKEYWERVMRKGKSQWFLACLLYNLTILLCILWRFGGGIPLGHV